MAVVSILPDRTKRKGNDDEIHRLCVVPGCIIEPGNSRRVSLAMGKVAPDTAEEQKDARSADCEVEQADRNRRGDVPNGAFQAVDRLSVRVVSHESRANLRSDFDRE